MVQRTKRVIKQEQEGSNRSLEWSRRYLENRELKKLGRNKSQSSVEGNGWEQSRFSHREENGEKVGMADMDCHGRYRGSEGHLQLDCGP